MHNEDEIISLDIRIGDTVIIERAGDVIPKVISVLKEKRPAKTSIIKFPSVCPSCQQPITRSEGEAAYRCINTACPAQLEGHLFHFASKGGFDIVGLGDKLARQLITEKLVSDPSDLFYLTKEMLLPLDLMADKKAEKLLDEIDRSKKVILPKVIYALGIIGVGESAAKLLAEHFVTFENLKESTLEDLENIQGIGPVIAQNIYNYFGNKGNQNILKKMKKAEVQFPDYKTKKSSGKLDKKTFVITGTLSKPRNFFKQLIEENGGKVSGSISSKTDYLLAGAEAGSKLDKANKLKVIVLQENELLDLLK